VKGFVMTVLAIWVLSSAAWAAPQGSQKSGKKHQARSQAKSPSKPYGRSAKSRLKAAAPTPKPRPQPVRLATAVQESAGHPDLRSTSAFVVDQTGGRTLYAKNITTVQPIASITKLMTAMIVLDAKLDLNELVAVTEDDVDSLKHTRSRLQVGTVLPRDDMLRLALMASENRAASALSRAYPGGFPAFIVAMNRKAVELGMMSTHFLDSTGLNRENVSTAEDLAKMVTAAYKYPVIQQYTTLTEYSVRLNNGRVLAYRNSNGLVRSDDWHIDVSKTGYISEAGRCLVMQARISATPVVIVLLDSWGKYTRIADANRIKKWVESQLAHPAPG
jgi:D-alanyl-D-alanine endopeptidase (penicillin-binding protein 7)